MINFKLSKYKKEHEWLEDCLNHYNIPHSKREPHLRSLNEHVWLKDCLNHYSIPHSKREPYLRSLYEPQPAHDRQCGYR